MRSFLTVIFYIILIINLDFFAGESFGSVFYHGFALITSVLLACLLTRKGLLLKMSGIKTVLALVFAFAVFKACQVFIQGKYHIHIGQPDYWMLFLSLGLVSIGEELFFRGVLFDDVQSKFNTKVAIFISIFFFVVMHIDKSFINLMTFQLISAVALTYFRVKYKTVTMPILAHVAGNYTVFFLLNGI